jgi:hypothetical protein
VVAVPTHHDLFGPQPGSGNGFQFTPGVEFDSLTAFTANTKSFYFGIPQINLTTPKIVYADWQVVWLPTAVHRARLRWHYNDAGGMHFTDIGEIVPEVTDGPIPSSLNITAALQAAQATGRYVHIGQSFKGDNATPMVLYSATLSIYWRAGYYGA